MPMFSRLFTLACAATAAAAGWAQTLVAGQALTFGSFAAGSGGTVTISAAGARSAGGGVVLVSSGPGAVAQFTVSGDANAGYAITLPANGEVSLTSGANSMAVNNFVSNPASTGQIGGGGSQTLMIGATLSVGNSQPPGNYSGTFNVTVIYN